VQRLFLKTLSIYYLLSEYDFMGQSSDQQPQNPIETANMY